MTKTIGVFAPSSRIDRTRADTGKAWLEQHGFHVQYHPQTFAGNESRSEAGTPAERAAAFMDLLRDDSVDVILAARGGNRCMHVLPHIDWTVVRAHPKPVMGFSDFTCLLTAMHTHANAASWHGPGLGSFADENLPNADKLMAAEALRGTLNTIDVGGVDTTADSAVTGTLLGGNLSLISALCGTPYWPTDWRDKILFLEDWNEELSRTDRQLQTLALAGVFKQVRAVIIGQFHTAPDTGRLPLGMDLVECVLEKLDGRDLPVRMNANFGHGDRLVTLPVGRSVTLEDGIITI